LVDDKRSYCILPLFHEDEQYGLIAVEVNTYVLCVYDSLNGPIGSTIKSILLTEELNSMNRKLEKTNEHKIHFFINIEHEMKTSLTLIQNYLDRYMACSPSDPDLAVVKQNIDIMLENILNFLDEERLEKGTISYSHDVYLDLSKSARKKCALFRVVAVKKNYTASRAARSIT
jgi:signal transduction histidine kinase